MISLSAARRASSRQHSSPSIFALRSTVSTCPPLVAEIKKPMRPLTAYHIFFQIEREYIIQTAAGPVADKSIHENKSYLHDVPRRYRCIKLLPDWYAGPGKRKKRKHRKSHGKIGFLELSRVISRRWATLDATDPQTKRYVTMIAARELDEYKIEMKRYKELTEVASAPPTQSAHPASADVSTSPVVAETVDERLHAGVFHPEKISSASVPTIAMYLQEPMHTSLARSEELVLSLERESASSTVSNDDDEIDYTICSVSNDGNYIPSPAAPGSGAGRLIPPDGKIYDPLFELEQWSSFPQPAETRCVSPLSPEINAKDFDLISHSDVFRL